eukprot:gnl/TRDRNA2_/TRDRNA2_153892_c1_seq1.p1 gnl/TRDRNA2_/TRDRNA2_153892_c1~~gnl/TRDRNA2_/TRDRNA2_153892_c1_seq1.p1  ORF type:complete len:420 (-),score=87.14 gnl/TRDRNA2_/TRDRNA2_153892_c1_seq1:43-1272(-)
MRVVEKMSAEDRLSVDDERLRQLAEAWHFFGILFAICDDVDGSEDNASLTPVADMAGRQQARQPTFKEDVPLTERTTDVRVKVADGSETPENKGSGGGKNGGSGIERISARWLEEHPGVTRITMAPCIDQVHSALDMVGEHFNAGGCSLDDMLIGACDDTSFALQCTLANLQVWGAIGDYREDSEWPCDDRRSRQPPLPRRVRTASEVCDQDIECFLRKHDGAQSSNSYIEELEEVITPQMLSNYQRQLARTKVVQVRKELRRRINGLQHAFAQDARPGEPQAEQLRATVLHHLCEVEGFLSTVSRFFKSVDLAVPRSQKGQQVSEEPAPPSDSSDERVERSGPSERSLEKSPQGPQRSPEPRPAIDHVLAGYVVHVDCGHNGVLDEVEMRHVGIHIRAARFGRVFEET